MPTDRDFARFLSRTAAVVVLGMLLSIALVLVVDPYRIYRLVDHPGFNHVKPALERYHEEIKLTGALASRANALILGNSRAEIGFDPDHAGFAATGLSSYNLAIPGTRAATARSELAYLRSMGQSPEMIVLGVEFLDFLRVPDLRVSDRHSVSGAAMQGNVVDGWKWKFDTMFSLASVSDAIKTLRIQRHAEAETITSRGFNPLLEYNKFAKEQGYYALFQQRGMENAKSLIRKSQDPKAMIFDDSPDLAQLREILSAASADKGTLHLVIYPYHVQTLVMFEQLGLWPAFEQWKNLLAQEVAANKQLHPGSRISLWDFSGFSSFQCEAIPAKGDKTKVTQWYWEGGHFKPALGDAMLTRLLAKSQESMATSDMGFLLTPFNVIENQRRIAQERAACMAAYPSLSGDVAALIKNSRRPHR